MRATTRDDYEDDRHEDRDTQYTREGSDWLLGLLGLLLDGLVWGPGLAVLG